MKVSDYMTTDVVTANLLDGLRQTHVRMQARNIRHLPVLHGGKLYGVVSDRDLGVIAGLNEVDPDETTVEEAMTQDVYTVPKDASLFAVLQEMLAHKYGSTLVVEGGKVIGIFTTYDALGVLVEHFPGA